MKQKKRSCLTEVCKTHQHTENGKILCSTYPSNQKCTCQAPLHYVRTEPYASCLRVSLSRTAVLYKLTAEYRKSKASGTTLCSICRTNGTNTLDLVHFLTLPLHGTTFSKCWEGHYSTRCLEVGRRQDTTNPTVTGQMALHLLKKLGPLSSSGLQKASTHNLRLCSRVNCWQPSLTKPQ